MCGLSAIFDPLVREWEKGRTHGGYGYHAKMAARLDRTALKHSSLLRLSELMLINLARRKCGSAAPSWT